MRFVSPVGLIVFIAALGCYACSAIGAPSSDPKADAPKTAAPQHGREASTNSNVAAKSSAAKPYRLLGILDPDREKMVAFALKVPTDWRAKQEFQRKWEGAVALPQIGITLRAPDDRSQIVYFPSTQYLHSEGPLTSNLRTQKRSLGIAEQRSPNELAPMAPVAYLKDVFLPSLSQNGIVVRDLGHEQNAPETRDQNGQTQNRGSVDGVLPNGNRARFEVRISKSARQLGTDTYHTWTVVPSITQTSAGDLDAIHAHTRVAQDSIVVNPAWLKMEQEQQSRGYQANQEASRRQHEATMGQIRANTEAMTRGHEQRMQAIRQFGEANTARFNQRMSDMDRDQRIRVDTIRGETKFENAATGQRVKVQDAPQYIYQSEKHPSLFLGSDTPIDPQAVDWQELQRVQLSDY